MNIVIYGDASDTILSDLLTPILARYGGVQVFSADKFICTPSGCTPKFFIYDINKMPYQSIIDGIFIFKDKFRKIDLSKVSNNVWHVVDSQNIHAIKALQGSKNIVLTCGVDSKSTLTFSSRTATEALVNLQRFVKTQNKVLEPHEFTIKITSTYDDNFVLLVCSVLLLAEIPSLEGFEI